MLATATKRYPVISEDNQGAGLDPLAALEQQVDALLAELVQSRKSLQEVSRVGFGLLASSGRKRGQYAIELEAVLRTFNPIEPCDTPGELS